MAREAAIDGIRHARWAAPVEGAFSHRTLGRHRETQLTKDYHRVEKGLALGAPRRPFGVELDRRLQIGLTHGTSEMFSQYAESARAALNGWNERGVIDEQVALPREAFVFSEAQQQTIADLFTTRRSVRVFHDSPVDTALIERAVGLAANTPSVCNRQSARAHLITAPEEISRVLALQNGNSGFGQVPAVIVITVDLRLFAGAQERNQRWVDGGLFAMSLGWALHSVGLATCMLNWSMSNSASRSLRAAAGLEPWEDIVTLMAIGNQPHSYRVARSPRRPKDEILIVHPPSTSTPSGP